MKVQSRSIDSGAWGDKISWELYPANDLKDVPALELCTAVFCLAITEDEKILLMRAARGWSILGGHIEEGESIPDTLMRESLEEGGFYPENPQVFAYRKILSTEPIPHQNPDKFYPHPVGYNVFYWATTNRPLVLPTGTDVLESKVYSLEEAVAVHPSARSIIEFGYAAYLNRRAR